MKNEKSPPLFVGAGAVEWTWRGIQARHEHVKNSAPYDILMRVLFSLFICGRLQSVTIPPLRLHCTVTASPDAANARILLTLAVTTPEAVLFPLK